MLAFQELAFRNLGGIQTKKALTEFSPRDAFSCVGGHFNDEGAFSKRRGGGKRNQTALSSYATSIFDFKYNNDVDQKIYYSSGTAIYDDNGGSPSSVKTGLSSGNWPDWQSFENFAFFANGADDLLKSDGTTFTNAGIDRPGTSPTLATSNGAGTLTPTDTFLIAVTYVSADGVESNPCDNGSITIGGGHNQIDLTNVPVSTDTQVTKRYIYVTNANNTVLFYHGEINDNVTTTYTILDVNSLGALLEYTHDVAPEGLKGIELFKNRLFGFKDNKIYFSKLFAPYYWPQGELDTETVFSSEVADGSPITGMKSFFDVLLVFKRYDIYVLSGNNELDFTISRLRSDERVGAVNDRSIIVIDNYCYFLSENSVFRTDGITVQNMGEPISDFFDENSSSTTYKVYKDYIDDACAVYDEDNNLYLLFIHTGTDPVTENNMCFALDVRSVAAAQKGITADWSLWPGFSTQCASIVTIDGAQQWWRGDENGYIFRQNTLDGDGSNITSTATSGGASTLIDTAQLWTVDAYAGLRVNILSGTGEGQERDIASNTADTLTVTTLWDTEPDDTSVYTVGGIPWHYTHSWNDYGTRSRWKRLRFIRPYVETSGNYDIALTAGFDFSYTASTTLSLSLNGIAFWDSAMWDVDVWDGKAVLTDKLPISGSKIHIWNNIKVENNAAGQPCRYSGVDKLYQMKGYR
jgi:hypothetical protein